MKRPFWILSTLFFLFSGQLSAQSRFDSLRQALQSSPKEQKVAVYLQLAWANRTDFPDSTIMYVQKGLGLVEQTQQHYYKAQLYNYWGVAYWYKGDFYHALEKYKQALRFAENNEDSFQIAHAYHNMGRVHHAQTNYANAYTYFYQSLRLFEQLKDSTGMGYCYQSLSISYQNQGKYQKAIQVAKKSLELRRATHDPRAVTSTMIEIAHIYQQTEDYTKALESLNEAEIIAQSLAEETRTGEITLELAETYYLQQNYETALVKAKEAYEKLAIVKSRPLSIRSGLLLAKLNYQHQNYREAESYLKVVLGPQNKMGNLQLRSQALLYYSLIQEQLGDYTSALQYYKAYNATKDTVSNIEKTKAIGALEGKFELLQKEQENNYLKNQEQVNKSIIEKQEERNLALVIIVLLGAGLMIILIWKNRQTNLLYALLKEQKDKTEAQYAEVKRSKEKLEELNKEKDGLMGIVAHDLKAPLNRIKGYVQIIKLTAELNDEQNQYIQGIEDASQSGRNLIRDLLDVSAYEQEELSLQIEDFQLHKLTEQIVKTYTLEASEKDIQVHYDVDDSISMETDYTLLSRIVDNLFSNAIKFSPKERQIYFKTWQSNTQAFISIKDQGPGFSEDDKKKMFKKFQQLSAQPTGGEQSTGLGLAIVKSLSNRLGGEVTLNSEQGKGAEFVIQLPLKEK